MTIFAKVREEALPEMQSIYEQLSRAVAEQSVAIENLLRKWPTNKAFGYERLMPAIMYAAEKDDLPLVKALVELHGGWVALESEPGSGATFTCHLPETAEGAAGHPELEF